MTVLRFAALIRVSTERQEQQGESLNVQEKQIREAVERLGGKLIDECMYKGQEHSTAGYERKMLNELLDDARKKKFDAVIVVDPSRWGRDNYISKKSLKILKDNGIRFFDVSREYNLDDPQDCAVLGVLVEMNEMIAAVLSKKSMDSRYDRAKRGFPSFGSKPFGFCVVDEDKNKNAIWEVIPECKTFLERAKNLYLNNNYGFDKVLELLREDPLFMIIKEKTSIKKLDATTLSYLLQKAGNSEYEIKFKDNRFKPITIKLPGPLLKPEDIKAIKEKAAHNKPRLGKAYHGKYPLSGVLRCPVCGYSLTGMESGGYRYYRHNRGCLPGCTKPLKANVVEAAVLYEFSLMLNNAGLLNKAVKKALSFSDSEIQELESRRNQLSKLIEKCESERKNLINFIAENSNRKQWKEIAEKVENLNSSIDGYEIEINKANDKLVSFKHRVDLTRINELSKQFRELISRSKINSLSPIQKKDLVEALIGGRTVQDRKRDNLGIFVFTKHDSSYDEDYHLLEIRGAIVGIIRTAITNVPYIADKNRVNEVIEYPDLQGIIESLDIIKTKVVPELNRY